jgi:hypothetical protein
VRGVLTGGRVADSEFGQGSTRLNVAPFSSVLTMDRKMHATLVLGATFRCPCSPTSP